MERSEWGHGVRCATWEPKMNLNAIGVVPIYGSAIATLEVEGELSVGIDEVEGRVNYFGAFWRRSNGSLGSLHFLSFSFLSHFLSLSSWHGYNAN
jgi:hypothetical protein